MNVAASKPRVFYVTYDGVGEPLGRSQVLAYLFRLAREYDITLFSFEKSDADLAGLESEIHGHGIDWRPLSYHKRPPVVSTIVDVLTGWRAIGVASRAKRPDIVHVRSYVPALIALCARRWTSAKLLFDIRGFWADERVEGGIWPTERLPYRALYRVAKWCETQFFANADAVVTLTHASLPVIRRWSRRPELEIQVIPTCVDLDRFRAAERRTGGPHLIWCGSIGTWYRFDLVPALAKALEFPLEVITRQTALAANILDGTPAAIRCVPPEIVPMVLHPGDVGLSLCVSSSSKVASAPTRFAEYLAAGMPVVVDAGVGDAAAIVEQHRVGVVLRGDDGAAIATVAREVRRLVTDAELPDRCRSVARELFDVEVGSRQYSELYRRLLDS